ncbi:alpha/beta hydrolase-fold protein [Leyella stercorea]|uniref:alpha/beta hydrolase-fold protein n=1 Tax=Leyella stercorea TaxID=363265 RepID=UPI0024317744|nr:alpha/beta hydrolase-fold protein [Leyella stercorea]
MPNTNTIFTEEPNIQTPCKLFVVGDPQVLLIQPSARHEEKNDGVRREVDLIAQASPTGFAMVFFDCVEWARALMPWADDAVSRDAEVGRHAPDTLRFIEHTLLPWLRERFGALPCIIGGYSLGGLFALWAARNTDAFAAVAAASPSLWINGWGEYAAAHPILPPKATTQHSTLNIPHSESHSSAIHLSLGDREEHCRNQRMKRIGDCVRAEHTLLCQQLSPTAVTLHWHEGGHFGAEAERTAEAFAWCIEQLVHNFQQPQK